MKTTLILAVLALGLAACQPQNQEKPIRIQSLTKQEIQALHVSLQTGLPLEEALQMEDPCENFDSLLPKDYIQGSVQVPEDYSNPQGRKIKVFYYGKIEAGKDPIVFFNGGPGSDSHSSYSVMQRAPEAKKLSFIFVDQRGTGCSDAFPNEPTKETVQRLTHYGSTEIVKDSEVIREKLLGAKSQWKVFGQSYGGLITHRYAIEAPRSIKGAFAHGFSLMNDQTEWLKFRIFSQKRVLEMYFQKYPSDRQILADARSMISEKRCYEDQGTRICGPKVLDAMAMFLGFSTSWPSMHNTIVGLINTDGGISEEVLESFVRYYVFGVYNNNGLAGSVISMSEISGGESEVVACAKVQERLEAEGERPDQWLVNECRLLAGMKNDKWSEVLKDVEFKLGMTPEALKASLEKNPSLPFFLYSGVKDVFVPIETFTEEVNLLGELITYREFPNSGHEGFYTEPQVWSDILSVH